MTSTAASLALEGVTKVFGATTAVDAVQFEVPPGTMLGLLGPSGCGKTTVLRMIAGLEPVTTGTIRIDGADVTTLPPHRRDIGLVFQHYALFPHMTVAANVGFGLEMRGVAAGERRRRVEEALALVRLPELGERLPQQLSGGQQQRVALARALVIRPRLLLLDEPLSNLDARLRDELRAEIRDIQQRLGITTLFVTHDQAEALAICDAVGVMAHGRLVQVGSPHAVYERPVSRHVAAFVGRVNAVPCLVAGPGRVRLGSTEVDADTGQAPAGPATAVIRPHRIALGPPGAALAHGGVQLPGIVIRATFVGDRLLYDVEAAGLVLKVEVPAQGDGEIWQAGDRVACGWTSPDLRVLDSDSGEP